MLRKFQVVLLWLHKNAHSQKLGMQNIEYPITQILQCSLVTGKAPMKKYWERASFFLAPRYWQLANILQA